MVKIDVDILSIIPDHSSSSLGKVYKTGGKSSFAKKRVMQSLIENGQLLAEGQTRAVSSFSPAN